MGIKYALMIDNEMCYFPEGFVKLFGEDDFIMLSSGIEASKKYEILKKLDYQFSNYVGMCADEKYFKGRGIEFSMYNTNVKKEVEKGNYDTANTELLKSIKAFYDIHQNCIKDEEEARSKNVGIKV